MGVRCFIAIDLPPAAKDYGRACINLLAGCLPSGAVRWADPQQLHLTLHFLGNAVSDTTVAAVKTAGMAVALRVPRFTLRLDGLSRLPKFGPPRVITVTCRDDSGALTRLRQEFGELLGRERIAVDQRPWRPHLTLGRVNHECRLTFPDTPQPPEPLLITAAALYQSHLTPDGPKYARLATFPLRPLGPSQP